MRKIITWAATAACAAGLVAADAFAQYPAGTSALGGLGSSRRGGGTSMYSTAPSRAASSGRMGGGMGIRRATGVGGARFGTPTRRPTRQMTPNRSSTLSPYLNLVPGVVNSFGGQFLLRTQPAFDFERYTGQQARELGQLQGDLGALASQQAALAEPTDLQTGVSTTGHPVSFLNYGSYFGGGR